MKDTWKAIATGAICLLLLGVLSALGFVLMKKVPWLSAAVVVADFGIIFGGYKMILETVKSANDLKKVALENEKLKLEIEEKKSIAEKANAYVKVATLEEIEKYAISSRGHLNLRAIKWARDGVISAGIVLVLIGPLILLKMKIAPTTQPPSAVEAHIVVAKAPPGALVSVDGKPAVAADAQGNLSILVTPGAHKLVVSEAGFESFSEDISVGVGEKYREPIPALTVTVRAVKPAAAGMHPGSPDFEALSVAINAYRSVFVRASGKNAKECQDIFNTPYQGALKPLAAWCDNARQFESVEKCTSAPAGTPEEPTLTCSEVLTIIGKDGVRHPYLSQKTFHFAKSPDGTWKVSRLQ